MRLMITIIKEKGKRYKYLDLAGELKKFRNMRVMVSSIVTNALATISKDW